MSEAVEAEIIEPEEASELTVAYSPAVIEANFDALEAHVRRLVADYEGATYDMGKDGNVKAAKRDRAYLNGIAKEIDERRKAVSREYTKPLAAFEDRCKAVAGSRRHQGAAGRGRGGAPAARVRQAAGALRGVRRAAGPRRAL